jgi:hypothetical protein
MASPPVFTTTTPTSPLPEVQVRGTGSHPFGQLQATTTAARPANPTSGQMTFDVTLAVPIWWNDATGHWVNSAGAPV